MSWINEGQKGDFPGDPVVKILHFQYRGRRFDPWSGTKFPHATQRSKKIKEGKNDKRDKPTSSVLKNFSTLGKND